MAWCDSTYCDRTSTPAGGCSTRMRRAASRPSRVWVRFAETGEHPPGADKELGLFGTALGLAIGMFFSWAMVKALPDQAALTVPVGQLVAGTIVAALAGVAAAILPARQAARLDSLAAISTE
jgi:hypothetical protein